MTRQRALLIAPVAALLFWAWPMNAPQASEFSQPLGTAHAIGAGAPDPGALVRVTMSSTVGVLVDEVPTSMRSRVEAALLKRPRAFWEALARKQVSATVYRLIFRQAFYSARTGRNQLPLPPPETWTIAIERGPKPFNIEGHRLVGVEYTLSSVLVSDRD